MLTVLGTHSKVGKTFVASALIRFFAREGERAAGMIPVETGCAHTDDHDLGAPDGDRLRAASEHPLPPLIASPYRFGTEEAPADAAARAGLTLSLADLLAAIRAAEAASDTLVVEMPGAPNTRVAEDATTLDLARAVGGRTVLVAAFDRPVDPVLTACTQAGVAVAGVVLNASDPDAVVLSQTFDAPILGSLRHLSASEDPIARLDAAALRALRSEPVGR